ncbi:hypothetical protein BDR05DRAFT_1006328 [Suillus weaverae]|nr:hypothetical protein BDR05DRAFT_1006328 [Suillus weaverae]
MAAERTSSSTSNGEKEHLDDSINNSVWHDTTFFGSQREGRMASPRDTEDGQTVQYVDRDEAQTPEVAQYMLSSQTPSTSNFETPLLPPHSSQPRQAPTHSLFHIINQNYISSPLNPNPSTSSPAAEDNHGPLARPKPFPNRDSVFTSSGDSIFSLLYDSKYPSGAWNARGALVPYVSDPALDEPDKDDSLDDPNDDTFNSSVFPVRGILNVGVLLILILALLHIYTSSVHHKHYFLTNHPFNGLLNSP